MALQTCVLVTGVGGRSVGHQILHALLLLGDKYRIVAVDADEFSFGLYQVKNSYIVPRANAPNYLSSLISIIKHEHVDAILPGSEPEVRVLAQNQKAILSTGCHVIVNPEEVIQLCSNKWQIFNWLKTNGFATPKTVCASEWRKLVDQVGFPLVGKPVTYTGGSRNVAILKDAIEVQKYLEESQENQDEIIFQEYIPNADEEYTVGVLISKDGELIDSIILHRKLEGLSLGAKRKMNGSIFALSSGYSQGFILKHPLIQQSCEALALTLGIRGPLNIQCRLVTSNVEIFEVHPRFSGTTSIRAEAGFNEPDTLINNFLFGRKFNRLNYQNNVAAIRAFRSILVPVADMNKVPRIGTQ